MTQHTVRAFDEDLTRLHGMVSDMITLLEDVVQSELRRGRYPDRKTARKVSEVVKAVARELDA